MDRAELEGLDRESLVVRATEAGIKRARILTRPELIDELLRLDPDADEASLKRSRGFFGRARDLVARVVERGLHLPDAAEAIRGLGGPLPASVPRMDPQAVPTVTLAEIYAAQGHPKRAVETLQRVLEREPEHAAAKALLAKLTDSSYVAPAPPLPPEPEIEKPLFVPEEEEVEEITQVRSEVPTERFDEPAECVSVPVPGGRFVMWRVSQRARELVMRVVIIQPSWNGPVREVRDILLERETGEILVSDIPEGVVVRVAVGVMENDAFRAIAHSPALETSTRPPGIARWTLKGIAPVVLDDPRASGIARAVHAARRVAS